MVALDGVDPLGQVLERVAVGGQAQVHARQLRHLVEGGDEVVEGVVGHRAQARDVRRDAGQHVVAGQQHAVLGVEQAEVVGGVARRVHADELPSAQPDALAVGHPPVGPGGHEVAAGDAALDPARRARPRAAAASASGRPTGSSGRSGPAGGPARRRRRSRARGDSTRSGSSRSKKVRKSVAVTSSAPASRRSFSALPKWSGCEWVTTTVWTSFTFAPTWRRRSLIAFHVAGPGSPGSIAVQPSSSSKQVHVDVAEPGEVDRDLSPEDPRRDLGHLRLGVLLLLAHRSGDGT